MVFILKTSNSVMSQHKSDPGNRIARTESELSLPGTGYKTPSYIMQSNAKNSVHPEENG